MVGQVHGVLKVQNATFFENLQVLPAFLFPPILMCFPCFMFAIASQFADLKSTLYIITDKGIVVSVAGNYYNQLLFTTVAIELAGRLHSQREKEPFSNSP